MSAFGAVVGVYTVCSWLSAVAPAKLRLAVVAAAVVLSVAAVVPATAAMFGLTLDVCAVLDVPDVPLDIVLSVWLMEIS